MSPEFLPYWQELYRQTVRQNFDSVTYMCLFLHPSLKRELNHLSMANGTTRMFLRPSPPGAVTGITDTAFQFSYTINLYLNILDETT